MASSMILELRDHRDIQRLHELILAGWVVTAIDISDAELDVYIILHLSFRVKQPQQ